MFTQWKAHERAKDEGLEPSSKEHEGTQSTTLSETQVSATVRERPEGPQNEDLVEPSGPDIIIME